LIVETLPFETSLNREPPVLTGNVQTPKPSQKLPVWQEFLTKYRDLWGPIAIGFAVLLILGRIIIKLFRRGKKPAKTVETPDELTGPAVRTELSPAAAALLSTAAPPAISNEERSDLAERVRMLAKREPDATANVLRMWLQNGKA
jgi:flagellar biosynthesis/type III secretory pathway M-ring protein FliF/YscJ